jgi:hypothetical protein
MTENRSQIMPLFQRPVSVVRTDRHYRQSGVDPRQKLGFQVPRTVVNATRDENSGCDANFPFPIWSTSE